MIDNFTNFVTLAIAVINLIFSVRVLYYISKRFKKTTHENTEKALMYIFMVFSVFSIFTTIIEFMVLNDVSSKTGALVTSHDLSKIRTTLSVFLIAIANMFVFRAVKEP